MNVFKIETTQLAVYGYLGNGENVTCFEGTRQWIISHTDNQHTHTHTYTHFSSFFSDTYITVFILKRSKPCQRRY